MKLLIFLGNPWPQYQYNRHNIWFIIGDRISTLRNCNERKWDNNAKALITSTIQNGEKILLVKPQTFMNLSGQTVSFLCNFYKLTPADIIVIHDDIDLKNGTIKYKFGWSSGGQNGVKNIIAKLDTDQFARIRIGIDRPSHSVYDIADYVLWNLPNNELENIDNYSDETLEKLSHHFLKK